MLYLCTKCEFVNQVTARLQQTATVLIYCFKMKKKYVIIIFFTGSIFIIIFVVGEECPAQMIRHIQDQHLVQRQIFVYRIYDITELGVSDVCCIEFRKRVAS